jgi:hypothetical protein
MKLPDEIEKAFGRHVETLGIVRQRLVAREKAATMLDTATEAYQVAIDDDVNAREVLRKAIADALAKGATDAR